MKYASQMNQESNSMSNGNKND